MGSSSALLTVSGPVSPSNTGLRLLSWHRQRVLSHKNQEKHVKAAEIRQVSLVPLEKSEEMLHSNIGSSDHPLTSEKGLLCSVAQDAFWWGAVFLGSGWGVWLPGSPPKVEGRVLKVSPCSCALAIEERGGAGDGWGLLFHFRRRRTHAKSLAGRRCRLIGHNIRLQPDPLFPLRRRERELRHNAQSY